MDYEEILGGLFSKKGEKRSKKLVGINKSIKHGFFTFIYLHHYFSYNEKSNRVSETG